MRSKSSRPMFRTTLCLTGCIVLSVVMTACSRSENKESATTEKPTAETSKASPPEGPPADVVQASASQVDMTTSGSAEATVNVKIANGYHINGNPASHKFLIATTLDVESSPGMTVGTPSYPKAISKKFSFANEPIMVYESEVDIKQPLRADAGSAKGTRNLRAKLRVQPCDDTVCYPPRTLEVSIPVSVK